MVSRAQVMALCAGDSWLDNGANLILFGSPGSGKSHPAAAIGLALVENGWRVLFARTTDLVQKLQVGPSGAFDIVVLIGGCLCLIGYATWPVKTECAPVPSALT